MTPEPGRSGSSAGGARTATREHIRGSTLLLAGRGISLAVNFAVQVFTVRYLAKSDYGAFAYALAIVATAANAILLGLGRAVSRIAPVYEERRDYGAMYGTLLLAGGTVLGLGLAVVAGANALAGVLVEPYVSDPLAESLLLVLIALAPLQALDSLGEHVLAAFASPMAVFFRRFVLGPALKLLAVLFVVLADGSARMLAVAYVVAGGVAVLLYGPILRTAFARRGLLTRFVRRELRFPVREVLTFGLPLFFSDVVHVARTTLVVIVLEAVRSTAEVADFRAIAPVAGLNLVVLQSMKLLYVPAASRLFARGDHAAIDHLFWQTAVWISVATFPVLAACTALAEPVTVALFGD
ncbi:MAG: oligosaccharide flippase family protein, partial [Planctomycetota bacterium]